MSKSGNKGVKDPRLRAYHLLPPAQGPQVNLRVTAPRIVLPLRAVLSVRVQMPAAYRPRLTRSGGGAVPRLTCMDVHAQVQIFRLTLDDEVFNALKVRLL